MPFKIRDLSVLNYANSFTFWHCKAPGKKSDCLAVGYFNAAADMFASRDMILISAEDGGFIAFITIKDGAVQLAVMAMADV